MRRMAERGINLIGFLGANLGQGVAARNTAQLLKDHEAPFVSINVKTGALKSNSDTTWESTYWRTREPAPYAVNLFHMNPPEVRSEVRLRPNWLTVDGRVNAIVPFWELSSFPDFWVETMKRMDIILAPTRFIEDIARAEMPDVEIVRYPQTVYLPEGIKGNRPQFGIAEDDVVFVTSFDLNSDLSRKNPLGTIAAFREMLASVDAEDATRARLFIKVNNAQGNPSQAARLALLQQAAQADQRIRLLTDPMSYVTVLSLYASCDVFVSLHRSEGLGLGLLEAMTLGIPVIATGYSGNLDFMSNGDSRLVDYKLVPVEGTSIGSYQQNRVGREQMWAEPSVSDAARAMTELFLNQTLRQALGIAARQASDRTRMNPERNQVIAHLLELSAHPKSTSPLRELQSRPAAYWRARKLAALTLRRLRLID